MAKMHPAAAISQNQKGRERIEEPEVPLAEGDEDVDDDDDELDEEEDELEPEVEEAPVEELLDDVDVDVDDAEDEDEPDVELAHEWTSHAAAVLAAASEDETFKL
jgi:hypothetical protein